jgi:hypothetical protein
MIINIVKKFMWYLIFNDLTRIHIHVKYTLMLPTNLTHIRHQHTCKSCTYHTLKAMHARVHMARRTYHTLTTRNSLIHDGLLSSQIRENALQLTHDDDRKKRHVFHVIHLLERNGPSQIGFFRLSWMNWSATIAKGNSDEMNRHRLTFVFVMESLEVHSAQVKVPSLILVN